MSKVKNIHDSKKPRVKNTYDVTIPKTSYSNDNLSTPGTIMKFEFKCSNLNSSTEVEGQSFYSCRVEASKKLGCDIYSMEHKLISKTENIQAKEFYQGKKSK